MPDKIEIWEPYLLSWEMIYELNVLRGGGEWNLQPWAYKRWLPSGGGKWELTSHTLNWIRNCITAAFPLSSVRDVKRRKHISLQCRNGGPVQPQNALSICRWNCFRKEMKNLQVLTHSLGVFFCFRSDEFDRLNVFFSSVPLCKFYDVQRRKYWISVVKNRSDNVVLRPLVGMLGSSLRVFLSLLWYVPSAPRMISHWRSCDGWSPPSDYGSWKLRSYYLPRTHEVLGTGSQGWTANRWNLGPEALLITTWQLLSCFFAFKKEKRFGKEGK